MVVGVIPEAWNTRRVSTREAEEKAQATCPQEFCEGRGGAPDVIRAHLGRRSYVKQRRDKGKYLGGPCSNQLITSSLPGN